LAVTRLIERRVEKPWGRRELGPIFGVVPADAEPIGEIWFEHPGRADLPLLVKYLFTSQKLSIQVHPDDEAAIASGQKGGKDEAWIVLDADPEATIGIGLRTEVTADRLRTAALDGSIESRSPGGRRSGTGLLDWRPAATGDIYYSPAGTVHALGAGLILVEIQQAADLTYRLYDYGRPRELHLDEAVEIADPAPFEGVARSRHLGNGREVICEGRAFRVERWSGAGAHRLPQETTWLVPIAGSARADGEDMLPGSVWLAEEAEITLEADAQLLAAFPA